MRNIIEYYFVVAVFFPLLKGNSSSEPALKTPLSDSGFRNLKTMYSYFSVEIFRTLTREPGCMHGCEKHAADIKRITTKLIIFFIICLSCKSYQQIASWHQQHDLLFLDC